MAGRHQPAGKEEKRNWLFGIRTFAGEDGYLDRDGELKQKAEVEVYEGTEKEAEIEAVRRAYEFERSGRGLVWRMARKEWINHRGTPCSRVQPSLQGTKERA